MTLQLLALLGMTLIFLRERRIYLDGRDRRIPRHHESAAHERLRPRTGLVDVAPADCPVSIRRDLEGGAA